MADSSNDHFSATVQLAHRLSISGQAQVRALGDIENAAEELAILEALDRVDIAKANPFEEAADLANQSLGHEMPLPQFRIVPKLEDQVASLNGYLMQIYIAAAVSLQTKFPDSQILNDLRSANKPVTSDQVSRVVKETRRQLFGPVGGRARTFEDRVLEKINQQVLEKVSQRANEARAILQQLDAGLENVYEALEQAENTAERGTQLAIAESLFSTAYSGLHNMAPELGPPKDVAVGSLSATFHRQGVEIQGHGEVDDGEYESLLRQCRDQLVGLADQIVKRDASKAAQVASILEELAGFEGINLEGHSDLAFKRVAALLEDIGAQLINLDPEVELPASSFSGNLEVVKFNRDFAVAINLPAGNTLMKSALEEGRSGSPT